MKYENLHQLINRSSSSRRYFLSLPVATQLELHKQSAYIGSAFELHRRVDELAAYNRQVEISEFYDF